MSSLFSEDIDCLEIIQKHFDEQDLSYDVYDMESEDQTKVIVVNMAVDKIPAIPITIRVDEDGLVCLRTYIANDIDEDKVDLILKTMNKVNDTYRFVKLVLDEERDLRIDCDFFMIAGEDSENLFSITFMFYIKAISMCYPTIMKALWS